MDVFDVTPFMCHMTARVHMGINYFLKILYSTYHNLFQDKMIDLCEKLFTSRVGVDVRKDDIAHVELKSVSTSQSVYTRSIFVRFYDLDLRYYTLSINHSPKSRNHFRMKNTMCSRHLSKN